MYCESCFRLCGADLCLACSAASARDERGTETCRHCGARHDGWFGDVCEGCASVEAFVPTPPVRKHPPRVNVYCWAQPLLVGGLLLRVESFEGAVYGGAILEARRDVPLAAVEVFRFAAGCQAVAS